MKRTKTKRTRNTIGKRKIGSGGNTNVGYKNIDCFFCREAVRVDKDTSSALCDRCVVRAAGNSAAPKPPVVKIIETEMVNGFPVVKSVTRVSGSGSVKLNKDGTPRKKRSPNGSPRKVYVPSGRPRGWHLKKKFVDTDGSVYRFGVSTGKKTVAARKSESAQKKVAKSADKYIKAAVKAGMNAVKATKKTPAKRAVKKATRKVGRPRKVAKKCNPAAVKRLKARKNAKGRK